MKSEKKFDAVETMRQIRDKLSSEVKDMSFEEQKHYINEQGFTNPAEAGGMVKDTQVA